MNTNDEDGSDVISYVGGDGCDVMIVVIDFVMMIV